MSKYDIAMIGSYSRFESMKNVLTIIEHDDATIAKVSGYSKDLKLPLKTAQQSEVIIVCFKDNVETSLKITFKLLKKINKLKKPCFITCCVNERSYTKKPKEYAKELNMTYFKTNPEFYEDPEEVINRVASLLN